MSQVKPIFSLTETCIDGVALSSALVLILANILWDITKSGGLGIIIIEGYFIIKGMLMIYLQFLLIGNTVIYSSPCKLIKMANWPKYFGL